MKNLPWLSAAIIAAAISYFAECPEANAQSVAEEGKLDCELIMVEEDGTSVICAVCINEAGELADGECVTEDEARVPPFYWLQFERHQGDQKTLTLLLVAVG